MRNENYVLITGASEGFGKALALECAGREMNLILVALPGSGLDNLADYIIKNFGVKVLCFEHDLSLKEECYNLFTTVKEKNLSVKILINNAGMGGTHFFEERNTEYYYKQIELNVVAPTLLTHLFLEILEESNPAYILNVSSLAGFFYLPKKQVYGGTKSYLFSFSKSLGQELKRKNVYVTTVCPGGMNTTPMLIRQHLSNTGISRWSVMDPGEVAVIAMDGLLKRKKLIIPGFWNKFFILLDKLIPEWIKEKITDSRMKKVKVFNNPIAPLITPLKRAI
jgi:uncharacterized protein